MAIRQRWGRGLGAAGGGGCGRRWCRRQRVAIRQRWGRGLGAAGGGGCGRRWSIPGVNAPIPGITPAAPALPVTAPAASSDHSRSERPDPGDNPGGTGAPRHRPGGQLRPFPECRGGRAQPRSSPPSPRIPRLTAGPPTGPRSGRPRAAPIVAAEPAYTPLNSGSTDRATIGAAAARTVTPRGAAYRCAKWTGVPILFAVHRGEAARTVTPRGAAYRCAKWTGVPILFAVHRGEAARTRLRHPAYAGVDWGTGWRRSRWRARSPDARVRLRHPAYAGVDWGTGWRRSRWRARSPDARVRLRGGEPGRHGDGPPRHRQARRQRWSWRAVDSATAASQVGTVMARRATGRRGGNGGHGGLWIRQRRRGDVGRGTRACRASRTRIAHARASYLDVPRHPRRCRPWDSCVSGQPDAHRTRPCFLPRCAAAPSATSFRSSTPSCWRVQMACSIASRTMEVAIVEATRQPRILRA